MHKRLNFSARKLSGWSAGQPNMRLETDLRTRSRNSRAAPLAQTLGIQLGGSILWQSLNTSTSMKRDETATFRRSKVASFRTIKCRSSLRGKNKVNTQWKLFCIVHNLLK